MHGYNFQHRLEYVQNKPKNELVKNVNNFVILGFVDSYGDECQYSCIPVVNIVYFRLMGVVCLGVIVDTTDQNKIKVYYTFNIDISFQSYGPLSLSKHMYMCKQINFRALYIY